MGRGGGMERGGRMEGIVLVFFSFLYFIFLLLTLSNVVLSKVGSSYAP